MNPQSSLSRKKTENASQVTHSIYHGKGRAQRLPACNPVKCWHVGSFLIAHSCFTTSPWEEGMWVPLSEETSAWDVYLLERSCHLDTFLLKTMLIAVMGRGGGAVPSQPKLKLLSQLQWVRKVSRKKCPKIWPDILNQKLWSWYGYCVLPNPSDNFNAS